MAVGRSVSLHDVDWGAIPAPVDNGRAAHLAGLALPSISLASTGGGGVDLSRLAERSVVYIYPMTGRPDQDLPEGWDMIPGARGCTPQSCAFRDHFAELKALGVTALYGLSAQDSDYQREAAARLHLPFALLSDAGLGFAGALNLPTMDVLGVTLLRRLTLVIDAGRIAKVFYPVFPPDSNAQDVIDWLRAGH